MGSPVHGGRVNQKRRTRAAIIGACRELLEAGERVSMPAVAAAALVSEATAYRYFPDLVSLLGEALHDGWATSDLVVGPLSETDDPAARVTHVVGVLLRHILGRERGVRAAIAATIEHPALAAEIRPGYRLALIDAALAPLHRANPPIDASALAQLRRDLAVIVSAEALFSLMDLCSLPAEDAIDSIAATAAAITSARLGS